jgi:BirA family biotin operon repressor/biotin-[acetyl-CoA-carboxylase] ligase
MPFDLARVRAALPGRRIEWFAITPSTMTIAAQLVREGCASRTVVGADQQSAGIGRHGHSWHSNADAGLYVSIVLRLPVGANALPVVMLALGLAAQEAIAKVSGMAADLRWPNDVMIGGRKCAGILAQLDSGAIVAGIGINVNHAEFPEEIASLATSLRLAGAIVAREDLLIALLRAIDDACEMLIAQGPPAILEAFSRASSYASGRRVRFEHDGATMEGITRGLDSAGFLLVRDDNGKDTTIFAGGVRPI